ncbi:EamA family transporter [Candidatus Woesearchaeota archaeon]|nr:EamA family transporter [Candidatus Woesearchaeota archaeon]
MATKRWAIGLVFVCTLFTSFAQIFYKFGADRLSFNLISIITNWQIVLGLTLYGIGAVLLITALKGGDVSVLYPIVATSYIWVSLLSMYFFGEIMNLYKWIGIIAIFFGVIFVAKGGKKDSITYTDPV